MVSCAKVVQSDCNVYGEIACRIPAAILVGCCRSRLRSPQHLFFFFLWGDPCLFCYLFGKVQSRCKAPALPPSAVTLLSPIGVDGVEFLSYFTRSLTALLKHRPPHSQLGELMSVAVPGAGGSVIIDAADFSHTPYQLFSCSRFFSFFFPRTM